MNDLNIDLHMHSTCSDGTDTPEALLQRVREAGVMLFALTDHDTFQGCAVLRGLLRKGDPRMLSGAEFSCRDEEGKYHILGYRFDPDHPAIREVVETGHDLRIKKTKARLERLATEHHVVFPEEEVRALLALNNPGKPHLGNLMVKYGYAETLDQAMDEKINRLNIQAEYVRPEQVIRGILGAGGIPVLAHPIFGSGGELILGEELDRRVQRLIGLGLRGIEAFYSGFTPGMREEVLTLAEKYQLLVTAGSDYHGTNKQVALGDTKLDQAAEVPEGLRRFLAETAEE